MAFLRFIENRWAPLVLYTIFLVLTLVGLFLYIANPAFSDWAAHEVNEAGQPIKYTGYDLPADQVGYDESNPTRNALRTAAGWCSGIGIGGLGLAALDKDAYGKAGFYLLMIPLLAALLAGIWSPLKQHITMLCIISWPVFFLCGGFGTGVAVKILWKVWRETKPARDIEIEMTKMTRHQHVVNHNDRPQHADQHYPATIGGPPSAEPVSRRRSQRHKRRRRSVSVVRSGRLHRAHDEADRVDRGRTHRRPSLIIKDSEA